MPVKKLDIPRLRKLAQDLLDILPDDLNEEVAPELDYKKEEPDLLPPQDGVASAQMPPQQPQDPVPTTQVDPTQAPKPEGLGTEEVPINDQMNRREQAAVTASAKGNYVSIPAYHVPYVATPKFEGKDAPVIIKALVLEEGLNINNWRVPSDEFMKVAEQYKAGRHLRVNHEKTVESVIGMSFDGKVVKGSDVKQYLGKDIEGINPEGLYVAAEFEANPQDPQVRTNILNGYVVTGSIGLDAEAFCQECSKPLTTDDKGEMQKTCRHYDAPVYLKNVEVKEYSYVAEPAYEHTKAFPTFSAALASLKGSSIINSQPKEEQMSATATVPSKAEVTAAKATAKKGDSEGDADADGEADANALAMYKQGMADALKMFKKMSAEAKADSDPDDDKKQVQAKADGDADSEADASADSDSDSDADASAKASAGPSEQKPFNPQSASRRKTDQITKVSTSTKQRAPTDLIDRVMHPSQFVSTNALFNELFAGAAAAKDAPTGFQAKAQRYKQGRYE